MAISARIDELRKKFDENPRRYFAPLANEYRKAGDPGQAIFICETYLPQQPGHMSGHIVFGQALYELNRLDEARSVFETALSLDPENLIALRHLGDIARKTGDNTAARNWYQRVLEADPRNDEIAQIVASLAVAPDETPAESDLGETAEMSTTLVMEPPVLPQASDSAQRTPSRGNLGLVEHFDTALGGPSTPLAPALSPPPLTAPSLSGDNTVFDLVGKAPAEIRLSGPIAQIRDDEPSPSQFDRPRQSLPTPPFELRAVSETPAATEDLTFEADSFAITAKPAESAAPVEDDGHLDGAFVDESAFEPFSLGSPIPEFDDTPAVPTTAAHVPDAASDAASVEGVYDDSQPPGVDEEPPPLPFFDMPPAEAIAAPIDDAPFEAASEQDELAAFLAQHTQHTGIVTPSSMAAQPWAEVTPVEASSEQTLEQSDSAADTHAEESAERGGVTPVESMPDEPAREASKPEDSLSVAAEPSIESKNEETLTGRSELEAAEASAHEVESVVPAETPAIETPAIQAVPEAKWHFEPVGDEQHTAAPHATETPATGARAAETHVPDAQATEAQATEAQATEAQATEAQATEAQATEAQATETQGTETHAIEAQGTEAHASEAQAPETYTEQTESAKTRTDVTPLETAARAAEASTEKQTDEEPTSPSHGIEIGSLVAAVGVATVAVEAVSQLTPAADEPAVSADPKTSGQHSAVNPEITAAEQPAASEPAGPPDAFVTETMADLYLQQGHLEPARDIYRKLIEQRPDDPQLRERLGVIERSLYGTPPMPAAVEESEAPEAAPAGPTIRDFLSVFATRTRATLDGHHDAVAVADEYTHGAAVAQLDGRPEESSASVDANASGGHGSIDALFDGADAHVTDLNAATTLADAFAPDDGRPVPPILGYSASASSSLPLAHQPDAQAAGDGFSFDQFFAGDAGRAAPAAARDGEPAPGDAADVAQFNQWLSGLKKPS